MLTIPPMAQAALLFALILALAAGAFWLVRSWTGRDAEDGPEASELLTKFREVHSRGGLSDDEFRTIKTKLAPELGAEGLPEKSGTPTPAEPDPPLDGDHGHVDHEDEPRDGR
ncbi:hypothetical protein Mal64_26520 [Pseudobythopirellula maris]|uniref:SHOCT domain-containing protein n=1 Tax=Pseudobythopirellula maris TaxID=2527991 RepID=A0A5C5ZJC8_9BACT|nr:hypothetical protein [Pseudobythopirellula maris]TWT87117.1 hypothetical protein Mal64_26520 [Pseudobythopirellula maris]